MKNEKQETNKILSEEENEKKIIFSKDALRASSDKIPEMLLDGVPYGDLTKEKIKDILCQYEL